MRIIRVLLGIVAIIVLGVIAILILMPSERIAQLAADRVAAQTGRSIELSGDVGISWYPVFGVTTGQVSLGNADWSENGPMFQAESAAIGVELIPALTGDIRITKVELVRPDILLETTPDGRANWDFGQAESSDGATLGGIMVEEVSISDARIRYLDHGGSVQEFSGLDIDLRWPSSSLELEISGKANGQTISLSAQSDDPLAYFDGGTSPLTAKVKALGNTLSIQADVTQGADRPVVNGDISSDMLDLSALMGSDPAGGDWSKSAINADALGLVDGVIALSFGGVKLGDFTLGTSSGTVSIDRSRAVLSLRQVQGFDGSVSGELVANNRNGLSVGGDVRADGIELKSLLTTFTGVDRLSGIGEARVKFLASGNSVHAIMNSLSGEGGLTVGRGIISGIDLDKLFRGEDSGGSTVFDSLNGTFTMSGGVLSNQDLLLDLPAFAGSGQGRVGLGPRNIDYTFTPRIKTGDLQALAVPVRIQGPWSAPKIWPDMEALVKQQLENEAEAIGQKLEDTVKEAIGIDSENGGGLEQLIEDKAIEGVLQLLGGGN